MRLPPKRMTGETLEEQLTENANRYILAEDLQQLPFTTPDDIRDWHRYLCVPDGDFVRFSRSKGTTVPICRPRTVVHGKHYAKPERATIAEHRGSRRETELRLTSD